MLTATEANLLISRINKVLSNIGNTNGTRLPSTKSNTGEIALRYWLTSHMQRFVDAMEKEATKEAIKAGVIFDHRKNPLGPNEERQIFNSDVVMVTVKTANPSTRVDVDTLKMALLKAGVKQTVLDKAVEDATKTNSAPHRFMAVLTTKGE